MRLIDKFAAWLCGLFAVFAAPDDLSVLAYIGIGVVATLGTGVLLGLANYFENRPPHDH